MKKKFLALLLILTLLVGVLAACQKPATDEGKTPEVPPEESGETPTPEGKDVTIELYLQKTNVVDQFAELIKKFETENPGIKIELTSVPDPETALVSRIAGDDFPDMVTVWPADMFYRDLMADGMLMDISDQEFLNSVVDDSRDIAKYDGKDYTLSIAMSAYGLIVNNKIFADNNIELPETWEDLIAVSKKLQEAGVQPFTFYGKSTEQLGQLGERLLGTVDNDIITTLLKVGKGETDWTKEPQVRKLGEALVELHQYGQKDILGSDYDTAFNQLATEEAAMMIYGSWGIQRLLGMNPDLDVQMIPIPNPTGKENNIAVSIDTAISISEKCEHKEEALKFLAFMADVENAQWYADNEKNPPLIKGVDYKEKALQLMQQEIAAGKIYFTPSVYWPAGFRTAWEAPLQALIDPTGSHDIDKFLSATNDITVEYFAKLES